MKITQTKQVNLLELIKWAWENEKCGKFKAINNENVIVDINEHGIDTDNCSDEFPTQDTLFEIKTEIEINENTTLNLISVDYLDDIIQETRRTISDIVQDFEDIGYTLKYIYLQQEDGRIGQLLWENGKMVE